MRGGDPAGGVETAARAGGEGGRGRGETRSPVPAPTGPPRGGGDVGRRAAWPGCADSLNAALEHGPLRNCQRRGFPRGGHSIQPLHTPRASAAAPPPPPHKMAAPIEETAAASSAPFCGRREICQHGKPLRMHLSLKSLFKGWSRGDLLQQEMSATSSTSSPLFFPIFSKVTPEASRVIVTEGRREGCG